MEKLLDRRAVQALFGDISPATLWRGIKAGYIPKPLHLGPQLRRWSQRQCEDAIERMFEEQQKPGHPYYRGWRDRDPLKSDYLVRGRL